MFENTCMCCRYLYIHLRYSCSCRCVKKMVRWLKPFAQFRVNRGAGQNKFDWLTNCAVRQDCVYASNAVDNLRNTEIHSDACKRQRVKPCQAVKSLQQK